MLSETDLLDECAYEALNEKVSSVSIPNGLNDIPSVKELANENVTSTPAEDLVELVLVSVFVCPPVVDRSGLYSQ